MQQEDVVEGMTFQVPSTTVLIDGEWVSGPVYRVHSVNPDGIVHYGIATMSKKKSRYRQPLTAFLKDFSSGYKTPYFPES